MPHDRLIGVFKDTQAVNRAGIPARYFSYHFVKPCGDISNKW
jgi:hypothetical protein